MINGLKVKNEKVFDRRPFLFLPDERLFEVSGRAGAFLSLVDRFFRVAYYYPCVVGLGFEINRQSVRCCCYRSFVNSLVDLENSNCETREAQGEDSDQFE